MATITGRTNDRYTTVAIALHWTIAALILFNLATGLTFGLMSDRLADTLAPIHISSGITVLALTIVRIVWRLTHRPPPMLPMAAWEKGLAHGVHLLFYLLMLAAPLTGWAMISAHAPQPGKAAEATYVWGAIPLPQLGPVARIADQPGGTAKIKEAHETFEVRHWALGWILLGLFVLHVAGALKHQMVDRRRELARMGVG